MKSIHGCKSDNKLLTSFQNEVQLERRPHSDVAQAAQQGYACEVKAIFYPSPWAHSYCFILGPGVIDEE